MWHTLFIVIHAVTATVALLAGCVVIARPALGRGALFGTYWWSLVAMQVFLVLAIAVEWAILDTVTRVIFTALAVLGLVMLWSADQGRRIRPTDTSVRPSARYVDRLGFTLISLFDAFIVVFVLNSGAPVWAVVAAGVLIAVVGHFVLVAVRARVIAPT